MIPVNVAIEKFSFTLGQKSEKIDFIIIYILHASELLTARAMPSSTQSPIWIFIYTEENTVSFRIHCSPEKDGDLKRKNAVRQLIREFNKQMFISDTDT